MHTLVLNFVFSSIVFICSSQALPSKDPIVIKTNERTHSEVWDFALDEGKIFARPRKSLEETLKNPEPWQLFDGVGIPHPPQNEKWENLPQKISAIAADKRYLIAITDQDRMYDTEFDLITGAPKWDDKWGWPLRLFPEEVYVPQKRLVVAASLLNQEGAFQEDIDGNPHTIAYIHTVYTLSLDGRTISFSDPWLPPQNKFNLKVTTPLRGQFEAINLAASGSTIMVIDRRGEVWTRVIDYDTMGGNPWIAYSYERKYRDYDAEGFSAWVRGTFPMFADLRTLPSEQWHPEYSLPFDAQITKNIAIVQFGKGNASREIRVEGMRDGKKGYFYKRIRKYSWEDLPKSYSPKNISDVEWQFQETGFLTSTEFLDRTTTSSRLASLDQDLFGKVKIRDPYQHIYHEYKAELLGFNPYYNEMWAKIYFPKSTVVLPIHPHSDVFPSPPPKKGLLVGGITVHESVLKSKDPLVEKFFREQFDYKDWGSAVLDFGQNELKIDYWRPDDQQRFGVHFTFPFQNAAGFVQADTPLTQNFDEMGDFKTPKMFEILQDIHSSRNVAVNGEVYSQKNAPSTDANCVFIFKKDDETKHSLIKKGEILKILNSEKVISSLGRIEYRVLSVDHDKLLAISCVSREYTIDLFDRKLPTFDDVKRALRGVVNLSVSNRE